MPRLVDYSSRFAFLREAAFEVVLRHGVGALSRRSMAAALGSSVNTVRRLLSAEVELVTLAADEVERRRRHGRLGVLRDAEPVDAAVHLLRKCLPDTDARVAEELVWLRLTLDASAPPEDRDRDGLALRDRFRVADGRYAGDDEEPVAVATKPVTDPLEPYRRERDAAVTSLVGQALDILGDIATDRPEAERALRALLAGLTLEVCTNALTPAEAVALLDRAIRQYADRLAAPARVNR